MDFTLQKYNDLLDALLRAGYGFITMTESHESEGYVHNLECNKEKKCQQGKLIILRHDVDLLPAHSLRTAQIEHSKGIRATYYFRAVPESWDENVIRKIADMGHEVGYHYESLTTTNGDMEAAYQDFCQNLYALRQLVPVTSICMHGSPRSPYDSKDIWKHYSYKELGIVAEPYLDTDFSHWFYLTDTGRRWDGYRVSVRDRIPQYQEEWEKAGLTFHTTQDIIARIDNLPSRLMMTTHPQRWNPMGWRWMQELILQHLKNIVKAIIIRIR